MKNKPSLQILFIFNFFLTGIRIIEVMFPGAFTYFLDCTRYFRAMKPRQKAAVAFLGKSHHGILVAEVSAKVFSRFVYSLFLTTAIGLSRGMLKLNLVETIP